MPNSYFKFKQFTIHQDQCAMKVCTDACILGAWFAEKIAGNSSVLDIGSGTGLLMLMLAQKNKSEIDGIEIDLSSYKQLKENIHQSKWKEQLRVFPGDVRNYAFSYKYDFIIVNPPFYENDLPSETEEKNLAKHSKSLTLQELISVIDQNLLISGSFGILLPFHREKEFEEIAASMHFHPQERLLVRQTLEHSYFRSIMHYSRNKAPAVIGAELIIQEHEGKYTTDFVELLRDYYLYL